MKRVDALVIGAGPAGATAALALARGGLSVLLVEKSAFPRRKVCGEYISASSWPLLDELGAGPIEASAGPPVHAVGFFAGEHIASSPMPLADGRAGRAVRRELLDTTLAAMARDAGAELRQPATVLGYELDGDRIQARIEDAGGNEEPLEASVVIAAHGSWERAPRAGAAKALRRDSDLLGFKAHFAEARLARGLMPLVLFPGGYGGLVESDDGCVSFSCCIRRDALARVRAARDGAPAGEAVLAHACASARALREALAGAARDGPWLAAGPIRPGIRGQPGGGLFRVGNAAGEAHPLVAEGIGMAIQSGWLLAESLGTRRRLLDEAELGAVGREYERRWRSHFAPRVRASHAFAWATGHALHAAAAAVSRVPAILAWGARWSGKAAPMPAPEHAR